MEAKKCQIIIYASTTQSIFKLYNDKDFKLFFSSSVQNAKCYMLIRFKGSSGISRLKSTIGSIRSVVLAALTSIDPTARRA